MLGAKRHYFAGVTPQADERSMMMVKTVAECVAGREVAYRVLVEARHQKVPAEEMQIYHDRLTACHDDLAKSLRHLALSA